MSTLRRLQWSKQGITGYSDGEGGKLQFEFRIEDAAHVNFMNSVIIAALKKINESIQQKKDAAKQATVGRYQTSVDQGVAGGDRTAYAIAKKGENGALQIAGTGEAAAEDDEETLGVPV